MQWDPVKIKAVALWREGEAESINEGTQPDVTLQRAISWPHRAEPRQEEVRDLICIPVLPYLALSHAAHVTLERDNIWIIDVSPF